MERNGDFIARRFQFRDGKDHCHDIAAGKVPERSARGKGSLRKGVWHSVVGEGSGAEKVCVPGLLTVDDSS